MDENHSQPNETQEKKAFKKKTFFGILILSIVGVVLYNTVNLKDLAVQRDVSVVEKKHKKIIQSISGEIIVLPGEPRPWLQKTFKFKTESGEELFLDSKKGWEIKPGVLTLIGNMSLFVLLLVELLLFIGVVITAKRWHLLLQAGEIVTSYWNAFRLTCIGVFFNSVAPGATGGDIAKAYFVVKGTEVHKERAIITIVLDRIIGLVGLLILACILVSVRFDEYKEIALFLYLSLLGLIIGGSLAFNSWLRDLIRLEMWLVKIPFVGEVAKKVDEAFLHFKGAKKIIGLGLVISILNHLITIYGCYLIGHSLGDALDFGQYLILLALGNIIIALPILPVPGGLGVREIVWGTLFALHGSSYNMGVVLATTFFLLVTLLYSTGGFFLLTKEGKKIRSVALSSQDLTE